MRLAEWEGVLDTFLTSNELPKLPGAGSISADTAKRIAHDRYDAFGAKRKEAARQEIVEVGELEELKRIADAAKAEKKGVGKSLRISIPHKRSYKQICVGYTTFDRNRCRKGPDLLRSGIRKK